VDQGMINADGDQQRGGTSQRKLQVATANCNHSRYSIPTILYRPSLPRQRQAIPTVECAW
jgi:hypothetical protein